MHIEIRIERPLLLLAIAGGFVWTLATLMQTQAVSAAVGGSEGGDVAQTEMQIKTLREEQDVLDSREEVIRAQLEALQAEAMQTGGNDPVLQREISETTLSLVALFRDRQASERELLASLREMWEAQGIASSASLHASKNTVAPTLLQWPVEPLKGISARFHDSSYKARFGMEHQAIDIPTPQESDVHAAADGVVKTVSDKGMGYSSLVIDHGGGIVTLYGHVTKFLVYEGQYVKAGDPVALSGGRPGTKGAGMFTTGPHLHFEVHKDGTPVNPVNYLPTND